MRNEFIEKIRLIPKDKLVFIDESGVEDNATIEYGWRCKMLWRESISAQNKD